MTKRTKAPRPFIRVTNDHIAPAVRRDSSHCMIQIAIEQQIPNAKAISVDLQTIRWSDPTVGKRYIWLTPRPAQEMLIAFDRGWDDLIEPIAFELRNAHVVPMRKTVVDPETGKKKTTTLGKAKLVKAPGQGTGGTLIREGGKPPPLGPIANHPYGARMGKIRVYGAKNLRKEWAEREAQEQNSGITIPEANSETVIPELPADRCESVKRKAHSGDTERAQKGSSWRCALPAGHEGPHKAKPSAHQADWL